MILITNSKLYDVLKFIAQIALPAVGTLYFSLAEIWGLPKADEVVRTIMAVDLFLGAVLGISSVAYNRSDERFDGEITNLGGGRINLSIDPEDVETKDEMLLKVEGSQDPA